MPTLLQSLPPPPPPTPTPITSLYVCVLVVTLSPDVIVVNFLGVPLVVAKFSCHAMAHSNFL